MESDSESEEVVVVGGLEERMEAMRIEGGDDNNNLEEDDFAGDASEENDDSSSHEELEPDSLAVDLEENSHREGKADEEEEGDDEDELTARADDNDSDSEVEQVFVETPTKSPSILETPELRKRLTENRPSSSSNSQKSVSYFVDFDGDNDFGTVVEVTSSTPTSASRIRQMPDKMTQSMYVRSESRESQSSVSFFVDMSSQASTSTATATNALKSNPLLPNTPRFSRIANGGSKSTSKSLPIKATDPVVEQGHRAQDQINEFFKKTKEYLDFMASPSHNKTEVRQKKKMGETLRRLLSKEEERLRKGEAIRRPQEVEKAFKDDMRDTQPRPVSAYCESDTEKKPAPPPQTSKTKPVLRRERTFDLEPGTSARDVQVVEIGLEDSPRQGKQTVAKLGAEQERQLKMFQQQKLTALRALKTEIVKLNEFEKELAAKATSCGPEPIRCWEPDDMTSSGGSKSSGSGNDSVKPVPRPRTRVPVSQPTRPARKCDGDTGNAMTQSCYGRLPGQTSFGTSGLTTFADSQRVATPTGRLRIQVREKKEEDRNSSSSSSCSWFIPNGGGGDSENGRTATPDYPPVFDSPQVEATASKFSDKSLLRHYKARKEGKPLPVPVEKSQAFFIEIDEQEERKRLLASPANSRLKTRVIDLESTEAPEESNLQEALRRRRPDYIARTKSRETERMAKKFVAHAKGAILENIPQNGNGRRMRRSHFDTGSGEARRIRQYPVHPGAFEANNDFDDEILWYSSTGAQKKSDLPPEDDETEKQKFLTEKKRAARSVSGPFARINRSKIPQQLGPPLLPDKKNQTGKNPGKTTRQRKQPESSPASKNSPVSNPHPRRNSSDQIRSTRRKSTEIKSDTEDTSSKLNKTKETKRNMATSKYGISPYSQSLVASKDTARKKSTIASRGVSKQKESGVYKTNKSMGVKSNTRGTKT